MKSYYDNLLPILDTVHSKLIELVREGILIISQKLEPIYLNIRAREICQKLRDDSYSSTQLPSILSQLSHRLLNNNVAATNPLIVDYQVCGEQTIRIRAYQFPYSPEQKQSNSSLDQYYILVFLEDRTVTLTEELKIEQKKYDLTERETQILHLLSQTCSYQEIASKLQISLNTVKFHVKNINSKRRRQTENDRKYL
jgi:ATP/maltotriose-dependent transcriptional regulator MalT